MVPSMRLRALVLVLLAFPCVALGADRVPIVLWHSYRAEEKRALEEIAKAFNGSQDRLELRLVPVPFDALGDKITAAIPQGKGPDLFIYAHNRIGDWSEAKIVEPIEFWVDEALAKRFLPAPLKALTYRDSLYGLPLAFKPLALVYNKKLVPKPPSTTDELIALAKKTTDSKSGRYGLVYENTDLYYHSPWLHGFGAEVLANGKPTLSTPEAAAALAFAKRLASYEGIVPKEVTAVLVSSLFNEGKAAMVITGPWFLGEIKRGLSYGVAVLPIVVATHRRAAPYLGSEAVMLSAKSLHKKEAFEAMKYLTSDDASRTRLKDGRQTVANASVYEDAAVKSDGAFAAFRAQLDDSVPTPSVPAMQQVWGPYNNALAKVIHQGGDPAQALAEAQSRVEAALKAMGR
jgi:arabinogalactan oligomer/maltooligosaccharide transport system substrate-binding protein